MTELPYPVFDADNHYYEALDAFTRYVEPAMQPRCVQWCEINGFSLATGRRILRRGEGPPVLQLSPRRIGIKESANATWQASRAR